jgi:hypothetical protein
LGHHFLRLVAGVGDLGRLGLGGDGDEDVAQLVFGAPGAGLLHALERLRDLVVRDLDLAGDLALAQARHDQAVAHVGAQALEVDAVVGRALAQAGEVGALLVGHVAQGLVDPGPVDLDACALGALELDLLHDELLEHALAQHAVRGHVAVVALQALARARHLAGEFAGEHDVVVDHGDDAIEVARADSRPPLCSP